MNYPKLIHKKWKRYKLIKEYKNYGLYEEEKTKFRECFSLFDLGLRNEAIKPISHINPEKVKYL